MLFDVGAVIGVIKLHTSWTEIGSGVTFYVHQASWIELEERILDMYICWGFYDIRKFL